MEQASYVAVRDSNLDALAESVNELLAEGYQLAGPLLHVPKVGATPAVFVQSLLLAGVAQHKGQSERESDMRREMHEESCAPARWSISRPASLRR
jgi:hypothetical protein